MLVQTKLFSYQSYKSIAHTMSQTFSLTGMHHGLLERKCDLESVRDIQKEIELCGFQAWAGEAVAIFLM